MGFPCGSAGKESACNAGDLGLIPGLGRSPGAGKGYPLQYSGLENSMDYSLWGHKELDTAERLSLSLGIKPMFLGPHPRWQKSHSGVIRWEPRKHHKSRISIKNVFLPLIHQESSLSLDLQLSLSLKSWDLAQMSSKASSKVTFFEAWSSVPCIVWVIWTGPPCPARSLMEGIHAAYANVDTPICPQSIKEWKKCLN